MNINDPSPEERTSRIFRALSAPARLQILATIGQGEACVCHLEAQLNLRQAYISQQLMELRDAGLLQTRREGRFIYYSLVEPQLLDVLVEIGDLVNTPMEDTLASYDILPLPHCPCPHCTAARDGVLIRTEEINAR